MSGGQDPYQQDWVVETYYSEDLRRVDCPMVSIAEEYLRAVDECRIVDVYRLREKLRQTKKICPCGESVAAPPSK